MDSPASRPYLIYALILGAGVGAALGVALDSIALGVALGAGLGLALVWVRRSGAREALVPQRPPESDDE